MERMICIYSFREHSFGHGVRHLDVAYVSALRLQLLICIEIHVELWANRVSRHSVELCIRRKLPDRLTRRSMTPCVHEPLHFCVFARRLNVRSRNGWWKKKQKQILTITGRRSMSSSRNSDRGSKTEWDRVASERDRDQRRFALRRERRVRKTWECSRLTNKLNVYYYFPHILLLPYFAQFSVCDTARKGKKTCSQSSRSYLFFFSSFADVVKKQKNKIVVYRELRAQRIR